MRESRELLDKVMLDAERELYAGLPDAASDAAPWVAIWMGPVKLASEGFTMKATQHLCTLRGQSRDEVWQQAQSLCRRAETDTMSLLWVREDGLVPEKLLAAYLGHWFHRADGSA